MLRVSHGLKDLFQARLNHHYSDKKSWELGRVRDGKLNDTCWGFRQRSWKAYAQHIANVFAVHKKKYKLDQQFTLNFDAFRKQPQGGLFQLFT